MRKYVMAITLVLLGAGMILEVKTRELRVTAAVSDVIYFESRVMAWAEKREEEGKLNDGDLAEIFTERSGLKVSESNGRDLVLRDLVAQKVGRGMSAVWPGVAVIALGVVGYLPERRKRA